MAAHEHTKMARIFSRLSHYWTMSELGRTWAKLTRRIRGGSSLALALAAGRRAPLLVGWCLTSSCNRACVYCGRKDADGAELHGDRAVVAAAEMAAAGVLRVSLTGGEPLLHPRLEEIAALLARRGVQVSLNTNGALLPPALPRLAPHLSGITISLDGAESVHDALRGEGSFRDAISGARAACDHGLPVALHAVLGSANLDQVGNLLRIAEDLDASIGFTPLEQVPAPAGMDLGPMLPSAGRWRETVDDLIRLKRAGQRRSRPAIPAQLAHLAADPLLRRPGLCPDPA